MVTDAARTEPAPPKSQQAYDWLKDRITNQQFTPGYRLVLPTIAGELGMSVVPVREAVRRLESEGLVTFERNVGARVSQVGDTQYRASMQTIAIIEASATALAARHLTADDLQRARTINEVMTASVDRFDPRTFGALNREFHAILYSKCPNRRLVELVDLEWARLGHLRESLFTILPDRPNVSVREHENLVAMIEKEASLSAIEEAVRRHRLAPIASSLSFESRGDTLGTPAG